MARPYDLVATALAEQRDSLLARDYVRFAKLVERAQRGGKMDVARLQQDVEKAKERVEQRKLLVPADLNYPDELPVVQAKAELLEAIRDHQVVVVCGETGSGKTTQLPKLCLELGRGTRGLIGHTQPRRLAARSVANRIAAELRGNLGDTVGYETRFDRRVSERSLVKLMTDGILLAELGRDHLLTSYDTIIIDEAHERSLNIDFLLGYLKQLLRKRRDLKVIVTSATIDTERFAKHFNDAPVISVEGRTYPVEVRYRALEGEGEQEGERTVNDAIVAAVDEITRLDTRGDVLVFLPGEREIRDAHQALERRKYRNTEVLPLYARLSNQDQDRVFNPGPNRRIVLATNVAETSLTVPRIRYVVDPGFARVKRYSPRNKLDRLHIEPISQASANQRKGRCGRIAEGICYRLYAEADFQARAEFTDPEIRRSSLGGVILRMLQLGLGRIEDFPFLEAPDERAVADGWQQLTELGAIDSERRMTAIGKQMARLPVDVKLARMLVAAQAAGCLRPMLVIASFLGIQDPRERPADARGAADTAHAQFADGRSEFVGVLRLWDAYRQAHEDLTQSKLRDWCGRHFLGFLRMREWRELHRQLRLLCEELGWKEEASEASLAPLLAGSSAPPAARDDATAAKATRGQLHRAARLAREGKTEAAPTPVAASALKEQAPTVGGFSERIRANAYQTLHRALVAGLPTQIGHRTDKGDFQAPRQRRFLPFPGSPLSKRPPPWLLAANLLDTQKVWGMTLAGIEPDWVIAELPHLLLRKHFDPHWSRAQGQVLASEQISLFGLVLALKKPVHYGRIAPGEAHDIFVRQGLVTGEINTRASFVADNLKTLEQAREEEAKLRRAGLVADEDWQARWYLDRVPSDLHSAAGLDAWWKTLPADKRRALHWSLADLLPGEGSEEDRYPKYFALGDARLPLHYRFEPGAVDDGVTLEVPLHLLNALDPVRLSWLAPGFVADKAAGLIRSLPKAMRRNYVPAPDFGRAFFEAFPKPTGDDSRGELARFLSRATGVAVSALDFDEAALEPHLRMNLRLREDPRGGGEGKVLAESRDLDDLRARFGARAGHAFAARAGRAMAASGLRDFPAQPIPREVPGEAGVPAYPALRDDGETVALQVFPDRNEAAALHPGGVRRLLEIALADKVKHARKQLPVSPKTGLLYAAIESQERLRGDIVDAAMNAVLAEGLEAIRDRAAFEQRRDDAGKRLFGEAMERLKLAEAILSAVAELKPQLDAPLMGWARGNLDDLRAQLAALVHPGFLRDTPADALAHLPRYLKGMTLRAERAKRDPARDQARMLELKPFADALAQAYEEGVAQSPDWQALRWDLEELRVSVFAQELGAKSGVSPKKLAQRLQALRE